MEPLGHRYARKADLPVLRSKLREEDWGRLARLLEFACTKPEWILLSFDGAALVQALALAAPNEFNLPLEIIRLQGGLDSILDSLHPFQRTIEKAKELGARELYCTVPQNSTDVSVLFQAGFHHWRNVVRFESAGLVNLGAPGYRSTDAEQFARSELIGLIERTSEGCSDSQIEFYRQRLGGFADAEMTLKMMESTRFDPRCWRVALAPEGNAVGIVLPVMAFGEPTVGFIGILPEHRGRNLASFLLAEAWLVIQRQGHLTLSAEADERNVSMHRALTKSQFSRRSHQQEWRMEL
jgi:GNAT superfamily N-acetyltransferase